MPSAIVKRSGRGPLTIGLAESVRVSGVGVEFKLRERGRERGRRENEIDE